MIRGLAQSVRSFLAERQALAARERQLIDDLNRLLPEIGYEVVPSNGRKPAAHAPGRRDAKPLECKQCGRRFAQPLHLGRHVSAAHRRKKKSA